MNVVCRIMRCLGRLILPKSGERMLVAGIIQKLFITTMIFPVELISQMYWGFVLVFNTNDCILMMFCEKILCNIEMPFFQGLRFDFSKSFVHEG